ncbi:MAG: symmetrical bis(5'-nucleosyl)-tetraphosphatase [Pseudomonadota bacterium]
MAVYAVGDVQGCFDELLELFEAIDFDARRDEVWFCGDLVNRGPRSLEVMRFVKGLGERAVTVLGNHDLHLLAVAHGCEHRRPGDTFDDVLNAPDRAELLDWLRRRPLLHHDETLGCTLIHAGLPPQWDLARAQACAAEVEAALRGPNYGAFLQHMYGDQPQCWSDDLGGWERLRFIVNCFTRLRFCDARGCLALQEKGPPGSAPAPYRPWFTLPERRSRGARILFGHWSTLGACEDDGAYSLDSGCLWGGKLTALRLDGRPEWTSVQCPAYARPDA